MLSTAINRGNRARGSQKGIPKCERRRAGWDPKTEWGTISCRRLLRRPEWKKVRQSCIPRPLTWQQKETSRAEPVPPTRGREPPTPPPTRSGQVSSPSSPGDTAWHRERTDTHSKGRPARDTPARALLCVPMSQSPFCPQCPAPSAAPAETVAASVTPSRHKSPRRLWKLECRWKAGPQKCWKERTGSCEF